jgi:histidinol phosphatase-like PHP family hydrolase
MQRIKYMIDLISSNKKQYKANLHCHSVLSDGRRTPEELKSMYKAQGYNILAITDHERPMQHQALSEKDFIMLTG